MLKYGNRDFRNLQEQVYANMRNIEDIIKGSDVMADYTLNIVGQVDEAAELPDADTYEGKLGDIYVVGESSPFHCYVFAKVYENENAPSWIDLGAIFVQGPQGIQGEQGPAGEDGADGAAGGFGTPTASASSLEAGSDPIVSVTASGPDTAKIFAFSFGIPEGAKGEDGDSATITVGSTTTGAAGTNASVTNSGTSSAAVLNFTIPKGDTGLGVPEIQEGDAGKVLLVNADETAAEWGVDNSLKLPESAPAAQQLVGINTSGEQNAIGIGSGITLANNAISVEPEIIKLDFGGSSTLNISDELYDKITDATKSKTNILYVCNGQYSQDTGYYFKYSNYIYQLTNPYQSGSSSIDLGPIKMTYTYFRKIDIQGNAGSRKLHLDGDSIRFIKDLNVNYSINKDFTGTSGTATGYANSIVVGTMNYANLYYKISNTNYVALKATGYDSTDSSNKMLYAEGKSLTNKYELVWNLSTGAYTVTITD